MKVIQREADVNPVKTRCRLATTLPPGSVWTRREYVHGCQCEVCANLLRIENAKWRHPMGRVWAWYHGVPYRDPDYTDCVWEVQRRLDYIAANGGRAPWVDADGWKITAGALCLVIIYSPGTGGHCAQTAVQARVRP